jgi:hypothetical protein
MQMTSAAASRCPECGAPVASVVDGMSLVLRCTACEWSVATTNRNHPAWDETPYSVFVSAPALERTKLIAVLAAELGLSVADARSLIDEGRPIAINVNAPEVYRLDRKLRPRGVVLSTKPSFPWPLHEGL